MVFTDLLFIFFPVLLHFSSPSPISLSGFVAVVVVIAIVFDDVASLSYRTQNVLLFIYLTTTSNVVDEITNHVIKTPIHFDDGQPDLRQRQWQRQDALHTQQQQQSDMAGVQVQL